MAVLCLMYHHTPAGPAETPWDVPLADFKAGIDRMLDAGVHFIDLAEVRNGAHLADGMHVTITFDDGHATNPAAFEYLASRSIRPAAFIVKEWSEQRPQYMPASVIAEMAGICDFGGHGATHTGMTSLGDHELDEELRASRRYLEDVLGRPVTAMALPGGMGDARVLRAARLAGYELIANSVEDLTTRAGPDLNRVCIAAKDHVGAPLAYATAPGGFWMRKRARRTLSSLSVQVLGEGGHARLAGAARSLLGRPVAGKQP